MPGIAEDGFGDSVTNEYANRLYNDRRDSEFVLAPLPKLYRFTAVLFLACLVMPALVMADEGDVAEEQDGWRYLEYIKKPHRWVSRRMGDTSRQIDGFFASEDLFDEVSGTFGELRLRHRYAELDNDEFDFDFRLKLRIPYAKDKLKFLLESDTEERETEAAELGGLGDRVLGEVNNREDDDDNDGGLGSIFAGLRQEIVNRSGLKIDLDAGIKLKIPPDPFLRGKFRRQWISEKWQFRIKESPYWFTQDGFGHKAEIDLDRRFSNDWASRASVRYQWQDDDDNTNVVGTLSLFRLSGERNYLGLVGSSFFDNDDQAFRVRGYTAAVRLRRRIYSRWLFAEVIPHVVWLRENQFEPSLALSVGLEVLFGEKYIKNVEEELLPPGEGDARGGVLVRRDYRYRNFQGNRYNLPGLGRETATEALPTLRN